MGLNLMRTGTGAVLGVGSGVLEPPTTQPLMLGTTAISYSTILEATGLVAGAALQLVSPYTVPEVADGLVDGGVALLARRGSQYAMSKTRTAAYARPDAYANAALANSRAKALANARASIGGLGGQNVPKVTLT